MSIKNDDEGLSHGELETKYLKKMAGICAAREMCALEIRTRLRKYKLPTEIIEAIIDKLEQDRFIDENRYARAYVRDKLRFNHWGKRQLERTLEGKGISPKVICEALAELGDDQIHATLKIIASKWTRGLDMKENANRVRFYRHLSSKGYNANEIYWILDETVKNSDSND